MIFTKNCSKKLIIKIIAKILEIRTTLFLKPTDPRAFSGKTMKILFCIHIIGKFLVFRIEMKWKMVLKHRSRSSSNHCPKCSHHSPLIHKILIIINTSATNQTKVVITIMLVSDPIQNLIILKMKPSITHLPNLTLVTKIHKSILLRVLALLMMTEFMSRKVSLF
jgi:hypothetical protein